MKRNDSVGNFCKMIQKPVEKKDRLSCFTGVPIDHDRIVILLTADKLVKEEKPHVFICYWNGDALINDNQTWTTVNAVQNRLTSEILVLGGEGEVYTGSFGEIKEETVIDIEPEEGKAGLLRNATPLGKGFLIVGMGGQVYLRKEDKTILPFDKGIPDTPDFESAAAFSENDIYAVGWKGAMWHHNGTQWSELPSPTDYILTDVLCAPTGQVYICGQAGTLLVGKDRAWTEIQHDYHNDYFWSLAWFQDTLYVVNNFLLLRYDGHTLVPVEF